MLPAPLPPVAPQPVPLIPLNQILRLIAEHKGLGPAANVQVNGHPDMVRLQQNANRKMVLFGRSLARNS
jgi:hypothetical protein